MYSCGGRERGARSYSGGFGRAGAMSDESVPLPPGMSPGAIIGKGGSNIKSLQARSGARVAVNTSTGRAEVSGSAAAVAEALRLLQLQIDAHQATGGAYPHPMQVHCLLDAAFGGSGSTLIGFECAPDSDVALAAERPEQLFVLLPLADSGTDSLAGADASGWGVDELMAGLSLGPSARGGGAASLPWVLPASQRQQFLAAAARAVRQALSHRPAFDELKLRFNVGKTFFYKGPSGNTCWTLQQLQRKRIPDDLKSVFSNTVTSAAHAALLAWLEAHGFKQVATKSTASLHVIDRESNAACTLPFTKSDGSLTLRKLKSTNTRIAFGSLLNGASTPDWRFKLLGQYHFKADPATKRVLTDLAASAQLAGSGGGRASIVVGGLAAADMVRDKERHKDKSVYEGVWPPAGADDTAGGSSAAGAATRTLIKVSVSRVYDASKRWGGYEVAGASPQLQTLLQQLLRHDSLSSADEARVLQHLSNVVAFGQAVTRCCVAD